MTPAPATTPPPRRRASLLQRWIGPVIVLAAGTAMAGWTWHLGPDPVIDFGRELYVPWRLAEGDVLYRDIRYFNGPLSPHVNALVFALAGESLQTIKVVNLCIVAVVTVLLYRLLRAIGDALSATAGCVAFMTLFAFAHITPIANFNWLTPYSHELPHGVALSLGMIAALGRYARGGKRRWLAIAGALLGLVFLTKAEVFLAAGAGALVALVRPVRAHQRRGLLLFGGAMLAPIVLALVLLAMRMPPALALSGVAGSWKWVAEQRLIDMPFYRDLRGTSDLPQSLWMIGKWTAWYGISLLLPVIVAMMLRRGTRVTVVVIAAMLLAVAMALGLWWFRREIEWVQVLRPLPLVLTGVCAMLLWRMRRRPDESDAASQRLALVLSSFALVLLAKMLLNTKVYHYGFVLAMPGTMVLIVALVSWGPRAVERRGGSALVVRLASLALLAATTAAYLEFQYAWNWRKVYRVGSGADAFLADHRGRHVDEVVNQIIANTAPDQTVAALPEGVLINYLARRVNPTGQLNLPPPEFVMYGPDTVLADFQRGRPDLIVLVHADTSDYGMRFFGADYGRELAQWINENYHIVSQSGALPLTGEQFGIVIMQRRDLSSP